MSPSPLRDAARRGARRLGAEPVLDLVARAGVRGAASPTVTGGARELLRPARTQPEAATRPAELLRSSTDAV